MTMKVSAERRTFQINSIESISFTGWRDGSYKNAKSYANASCNACGHEWASTVNNLVNGGHGCPKCWKIKMGDSKSTPAQVRIDQINSISGISFESWDGKYSNQNSKAFVLCESCNHCWSASVNNLVNNRTGCPRCSGSYRWTKDERESQIGAIKNIEFIGWRDGYSNNSSMATVSCLIDGNVWNARVSSLVTVGSGCPKCKATATSHRMRTPEEVTIKEINSLKLIEFDGWVDGYSNARSSKLVAKCKSCHGRWVVSASSLIHANSGCPRCAVSGFDSSSNGFLYALRSECGTMMKIGISNNYKRRIAKLKRVTPFNFSLIGVISGSGICVSKIESAIHLITNQCRFESPFDGFTEWRRWDDRITAWLSICDERFSSDSSHSVSDISKYLELAK